MHEQQTHLLQATAKLALECLRSDKQLMADGCHQARHAETAEQLLYREQRDREAAAFDDEAATCSENK